MRRPGAAAAVGLLLVAGGCATRPARPAPQPQAGATPPAGHRTPPAPAHPAGALDGCRVFTVNLARDSYDLLCGKDLVMARHLALTRRQAAKATPETLVKIQVSIIGNLVAGDLESAPMKRPLPIGGTPRPATMVAVFREPRHHDDTPTWLGVVSSWRTGPQEAVVLACGGPPDAEAGKRCGRIMGWMATHAKLPDGIPWAPAQAIPKPHRWISAADLPTPTGCTRLRSDARHLHLRCPDADLVLTRIQPLSGPPSAKGLKAVMDALGPSVLAQARKQHATDASLAVSTCTVGGAQGVCGRVRFAAQGQQVALDLAVGGLFHALATVECLHAASDAGLPALCAQVMSLAPPSPAVAPAPRP